MEQVEQVLTEQEIFARGNQAKALLEDRVLAQAFEDMLQNIMELFLDSHASEEVISDLHKQAVAIKSVRGTLKRYLDDMNIQIENAKIDKRNRAANG